MTRWSYASSLALAVTLAFAGSEVRAQTPSTVKVGFICPATGGSSDFGNSARLGAQLAVQEINEVGGFLGKPLQLVDRDDQAKPDIGRAMAEELVAKEKVAFTVGYCNSGVALKSLEVFQQHQQVLMIPVTTGTAVTAKYPAKDSFIFRMAPRDEIQISFLVDEIVGRRGLRKIAVFADKTAYGEGGLKDIERFLAEKGLKPAYVARFELGVKDLVDEVQAAKAAGAQAFIGYSVGPELAALVKSRAEAGVKTPLFGAWGMSFRTLHEVNGNATDGVMAVQSIIPDLSNERRSSFVARLKRHAGDKPIASLMAAAQTYDAIHLMLRALFQTKGDTSGPALKAALENLDKPYAGVVTTHERPFSAADHEAFSKNMVWLAKWQGGELRYVYQDDAKKAAAFRRKETLR